MHYHGATGDSVVSKGQIMGIDWNRIARLHSSLTASRCHIKGTVSQTAYVQVINQKWSDVFKFVICETKWRQQAGDNPHSHGGRRNNSGRKKFFLIPAAAGNRNGRSREEKFDSKENTYKSWLQAKLEATFSLTSNSEFAMNLLSLENRRR